MPCPFTGAALAAVPAINPDVTILHAQQIDADGNVLIRGIIGAAKEAAHGGALRAGDGRGAGRVTCGRDMNAVVLPSWMITAASIVPGGAYPSYAQGYYPRDNAFYAAGTRSRASAASSWRWMQRHVLGMRDHAGLLRALGVAA